MGSDYTVGGYTWKCSDGAATTDVWAQSPEAGAALKPVMEKLRELEKLGSYKGNLWKPAFTYNFPGYPRHHPINLAAFGTDSPSRLAIWFSVRLSFSTCARASCTRQRKPYSSWAEIFIAFLLFTRNRHDYSILYFFVKFR